MADTVQINVLKNDSRWYAVQLLNRSDGTGETTVTKVDISTLTGGVGSDAGTVTSLTLWEASWSVKAGRVDLFWDHTADDEMLVCSGDGSISYEAFGGLHDPGSAGGTGDILLTYGPGASLAAGDGYNLTLVFKKKW